MSTRDFNEYLDTLGYVPLPYPPQPTTGGSTSALPGLCFVIEAIGSVVGAQELLTKMISAMKLQNQTVSIFDCEQLGSELVTEKLKSISGPIVIMGTPKLDFDRRVARTHSLRECLETPELKKAVWSTLQGVMRELTPS